MFDPASYTVQDAYEWGGFIVGTIVGTLTARALGYDNRWVVLAAGLGCGMACGFIGHKLYWATRRARYDDDAPGPPPL